MNHSPFRGQFTRIKDISDRRRLPRLGKIRLGVKAVSEKSGKEYPKETKYFVCPEEVKKIYGAEPLELDVMFPINDLDSIFPQRYVWFGSSRGVKCMGDGEIAMRIEEPDGRRYEEMKQRECPCELLDKGCNQRASLMAMLPKVNVGGIYQIDLGSYHSMVDINSGLDYVQALVGRFAMVPLKLRREPRETHGSGRKETHYTLRIFIDLPPGEEGISLMNSLRESTIRILTGPKYALPAPVIENPVFDEGATVIEAEEESENGQEERANGIPSPEEEQKALKEKGMIPESEPKKDTDAEKLQKENDAKILNDVSKVVSKAMEKKGLQKWFNEFKKSPGLSDTVIFETTKLVNDKLEQIKGN